MINNSNENFLMDDANSPELDKKLLGKVSQDFIKVADHLKEGSYQIRRKGFSKHPVFILAEQENEIGSMLFKKADFNTVYDYKASMIEEFVQRDLVTPESEMLFKENYKDPDEYCCLFVFDGQFAGFIYIPFPDED